MAVLLMGCQNLTLSLRNKKGNLQVRSYSDLYSLDPTTISATNPINAIIDITYPDNTKKTIVTDNYGYYNFGEVDIGEYKIQPRYCSVVYGKSFMVKEGETTTGTIITPSTGIYYYNFNTDREPVNTLNIRQSLCKAVNRQNIINILASNNTPAYNLIPEKLTDDWCLSAHSLNESKTEANTLLSTTNSISLEILYNTSTGHTAIANSIKNDWESLVGSGATTVNVTLNNQTWNTFLIMRDTNKNYQVVRNGWAMDSNNLLNFYKAIKYVETVEYQNLLNQAQNDLNVLDFSAYELDLIEINNYLIDNAMVLPLYYYK